MIGNKFDLEPIKKRRASLKANPLPKFIRTKQITGHCK